MKTTPPRRPLTDLERQQVAALARCSLPVASMTKRFARDLKMQTDSLRTITEKQAAFLLVSCYRYRRQINAALVPKDPPPGYQTRKQVQEAARTAWAKQEIARNNARVAASKVPSGELTLAL